MADASTSPARNRLPFTWRDPSTRRSEAAALIAGLDDGELPLVRLPGGAELRGPSHRRGVARARHRPRARAARGGRPARRRRRPGRPRRRRLRRLRGPRHARRREHRARRPGRRVAPDRELPRLPGRHQRHRADQPRRHAGAQVRRPHATPYRALALEPGDGAPHRPARGRPRDRARAPSCSRPAPSTGGCRSTASSEYEGISVFYAAGPPEAQLCGAARVGVVGGGNSAGQAGDLARARRRARDAAPPPRRPARDDVGLPRSATSSATASPCATAARSPSCTGTTASSRRSRSATASACRSRSSSSSSARRRAPSGSATPSRATTTASSSPAPARAPTSLLETSVPGVFAAGDVRSGSTKRCATAVGEGAMAVQLVRRRVLGPPTASPFSPLGPVRGRPSR